MSVAEIIIPSVPKSAPPISVDDYESLPNTSGFELIDGALVEVPPMSLDSDAVAHRVSHRIAGFIERDERAVIVGSETLIAIFKDRYRGRKGDVVVVDRAKLTDSRRGTLRVVPDLVVEVVSPGDDAEELEAKLSEYIAAGIPEVWVIYPQSRKLYPFVQGNPLPPLRENEQVQGRGILSGFQCRVGEFFPTSLFGVPATTPDKGA